MDYDTAARLHKTNTSILALRKEWLPLAVSFLNYAFKRKHRVQLAQDLFLEQLDTYLDHINAILPSDEQYRQDARHYHDRWSEDDLIRVRLRDDRYVIHLSPHAERLLSWFDEMTYQGIIGTESRLRNIVSQLDEVVTHSTEDVDARLRQLHDQRDAIDAEIERIETTGEVGGLSDLQIRERLEYITGMARQLLRDFSMVEERFREMARTIQQAQLDPDARRGDILGTALDADEQLAQSDEGQSFRAFYELLTHPEQRETFDSLLDALFMTPRLYTLLGDNNLLQRLITYLLDSGEHVNQSNQRLAEHLRRVVDTRNVIESRRIQTLSQEIKHIMSQLGDDIARMMRPRAEFFSIDGDPEVEMPLERPLFDPPPQIAPSERPRTAAAHIDTDTLVALYDTFYIDNGILHDNIERMLLSRDEVTLKDVITSYPVTQGMAEIVAYLIIATQTPHYDIDRTVSDNIMITVTNGEERIVTVPRILFRRSPQSQREVNGAG